MHKLRITVFFPAHDPKYASWMIYVDVFANKCTRGIQLFFEDSGLKVSPKQSKKILLPHEYLLGKMSKRQQATGISLD